MPVKKYFAFFMVILLISSGFAFGQGSWPGLWNDINESAVKAASGMKLIEATSFRVLSLDFETMQTIVKSAPMENTAPHSQSNVVISLPFPDGTFHDYNVNESPVMAPELIAQFPDVRTFSIEAKDFEGGKGRIDITQFGFHAMLFTPGGTIFIDPYHFFNTQYYMSYYFRDFVATGKGSSDANCVVDNPEVRMEIDRVLSQKEFSVKSGNQLRTYRLALSADAEYTTFCGGTVAGAYSQMVTTVNRVNSVYINDLCIKLVLVANTQSLIYTNSSSDPYTNNDGVAMLTENQTTVDNIIGNANYDIGHVFSTGGGGIAGLGVVCRAGLKAQGVTGSSSPTGDGYDIDYVAHEMGHQFGANHTFNSATGSCGGGNRNASTAYENGSGTTIMAYAGICGADDLQAHSDPYFHTKSIDEIIAYSTTGSGNGCAVVTATGNLAPSLTLPTGGYTIPISTPFALTASATDPDGDAVTYCWEEYDLGNAGTVGTPVGNAPIFRSFNPTVSPTRYFPKLSSIIGNTTTFGEMLPTVARTLTFKCTVRDNKTVGGGVTNTGTVAYTVSVAAGPFLVTVPNSAVSWTGATAQTITWNVANTSVSPVSCANVNILLSTDGGQTWTHTLASNTPNDGTQSVTLPNIATTTARVKIEAVANIFFDMSNTNFTITAGATQNTAPAAPQNLAGTSGNGSVTLKWSANTESDFLRYRIYGNTSANPTVKTDSTVNGKNDTVKTITGLSSGTTYYYRITAVDSLGLASSYSNEIQVTTNTPPAAPLNLTATVAHSSVTLKWNKNTEPDFRRYRIYGGTSVNPTAKLDSTLNGITDTTKKISGLITGTTYHFRVTSVDSFNSESAYSNQVTAVPDGSLLLTAPNGGELWRAGTNQNITWSAVNVGSINIYYSSNSGSVWQLVASNVQAAGGSYSWTTPLDSSSVSKIKLVDASDSTLFDMSNFVFNLYKPVLFSSTKNIALNSISATFETTNLTLNFSSKSAGMLTVEFYPTEAPQAGTLPSGIQKVSPFFWKVIPTQAQFLNVSVLAPILSFSGVSNPLTLCWLKRASSGAAWTNIGGVINGSNLVSTVMFSSFSEFAIGTTDSNSNPLPVELTSFYSRVKNNQVMLRWATATEHNSAGFELQRSSDNQNWQKVVFIQAAGNSNSVKEYSYKDANMKSGTYKYRLKMLDNDGTFEVSDNIEAAVGLPVEYSLSQNYPNPFNPATKIVYTLPTNGFVKLQVYAITGQVVKTLVESSQEAGYYSVDFSGENLSSGIYLYRLSVNNQSIIKKMIYLK